MTRILCVGAAVVDFVYRLERFSQSAEKFAAKDASVIGGGCAANAAVAIARLGGKAILGSQLGDDLVAGLILDDLVAEGVDVHGVTRTPGGQSPFSSVYIDSAGERQIVNFPGKNLQLRTDWFANLSSLDAVLADSRRVEATLDALKLAKTLGITGILDGEAPVDPRLLSAASHVAFSMQGLRSLKPAIAPKAAVMQIAQDYGCWTSVTCGAGGVWHAGIGMQQPVHTPAMEIKPRDTLAAGDVWHGAFALAMAQGGSEAAAVYFANAAAALKCVAGKGRNGAPTRAELQHFIKRNNTVCT